MYMALRETPARPWSADYNDSVQLLDDDELSTTPEYKAWVARYLQSCPDFYIIWQFLEQFGEMIGLDAPSFTFAEIEMIFSQPTYYAPVATVHVALLKCLGAAGKGGNVTGDNWKKVLHRLLSDDRTGAFLDLRKLAKAKAMAEAAAQVLLKPAEVDAGAGAGACAVVAATRVAPITTATGAPSPTIEDQEEEEQEFVEEEEAESFFDYCAQPLCVRVLLLSTLCQEALCCQEPSNKRLSDFLRMEFEGDVGGAKKGKKKKVEMEDEDEEDGVGGDGGGALRKDDGLGPMFGLDALRNLSRSVGSKPIFEDLVLTTPAARAPPMPAYVSELQEAAAAAARERAVALEAVAPPLTAAGWRAAIAPRAQRSIYYLPTCLASSQLLRSTADSGSKREELTLVAVPFSLPKVLKNAKTRLEAKDKADAKAAKIVAAAAAKVAAEEGGAGAGAGAGVGAVSSNAPPSAPLPTPIDLLIVEATDQRSYFFYVWVDREDVPRLIRSRSSMPFESVPRDSEFREALVVSARAALENEAAAKLFEERYLEAAAAEKAATAAAASAQRTARLAALSSNVGGQYLGTGGASKRPRDPAAPTPPTAPPAKKGKEKVPIVGQRSIMGFFASSKPIAPAVEGVEELEVEDASEAAAAESIDDVAPEDDSVAAEPSPSPAPSPAPLPMPSPAPSSSLPLKEPSVAEDTSASAVIGTAVLVDLVIVDDDEDDLVDTVPKPHEEVFEIVAPSPGRSGRPQREAARRAYFPAPPSPTPPPKVKPIVAPPEPDPVNVYLAIPNPNALVTSEYSFATLAVGLEELETFTESLGFSTSPFDAALADELNSIVLPELRDRIRGRRPKRSSNATAERAVAISLREAREPPPPAPLGVRSSRLASKGKTTYTDPGEDDW